jgi:NADPH:quinone reductase-like Zn-dependent oxidoreductase
MKSISADRFGGPELLTLSEAPIPEPKAGEVRVKVKAAGVNPLDVQTRRGDYSDYVSIPLKLGVELSGVIDALGEGVTDFAIGDEVFYSVRVLENEGGYAEYHTEQADLVAKKPSSLSFVEAAAMPIAASTAWVCLIERGRLQSGERVLILGGSGGVGQFAVQVAHNVGAYVVTSVSENAQDFVRELGADKTVNYKQEDVWEVLKEMSGNGFDVVVDLIGGDAIQQSLTLLAPGGRVVSIVDQPQAQNLYSGWDSNAEIHLVFLTPSAERLTRLGTLADRGLLKSIVERTLTLSEASEAHRLIEAGGRKGKIVLTVS